MRPSSISAALAAVFAIAAASSTALAQTSAEPTIKPSVSTPSTGQPGAPAGRGNWEKRIEERFKKADTNNDGALTKEEAQKGGMERVANNFERIDANKDGKVTLAEISGAVAKGRQDMKDPKKREGRMKEEFSKADTNQDGFLTEDEMTRQNARLAVNFKAIDANSDGKVSQAELKAYMDKMVAARGKGGK